MGGGIPVMRCTHGLADREVFVLADGASLTMGRSRACDVAFPRFRNYLKLPEAERVAKDKQYALVSRTHLKLSVHGTLVRCENLSKAGSSANGVAFSETIEHDLATGPLALRLGKVPDTFTIALTPESEIEALLQPSVLIPPAAPRAETMDQRPADTEPAGQQALPDPVGAAVTFPDGRGTRTLVVPPGDELLAVLESAGAACAQRGCGIGSCHTCKLRAVEGRGNVTTITEHDTSGLETDEFLPCCSSVSGPVSVVKA